MQPDFSELGHVARRLAAVLREHFYLKGEPTPASGGPSSNSFIELVAALTFLKDRLPVGRKGIKAALPPGSTLEQKDALGRIRTAYDAIVAHYGLPLEKGGVIETQDVSPLDRAAVLALEWSAGKLAPESTGGSKPTKGKRTPTKTPKKRGPKGPRNRDEAKADKETYNRWKASGYRSIADFARKEGVITKGQILRVRRTIERERKRRSRKGSK